MLICDTCGRKCSVPPSDPLGLPITLLSATRQPPRLSWVFRQRPCQHEVVKKEPDEVVNWAGEVGGPVCPFCVLVREMLVLQHAPPVVGVTPPSGATGPQLRDELLWHDLGDGLHGRRERVRSAKWLRFQPAAVGVRHRKGVDPAQPFRRRSVGEQNALPHLDVLLEGREVHAVNMRGRGKLWEPPRPRGRRSGSGNRAGHLAYGSSFKVHVHVGKQDVQ